MLLTELAFLIVVIMVVKFLHFCGNDYICSTDVVDVGFRSSFLRYYAKLCSSASISNNSSL